MRQPPRVEMRGTVAPAKPHFVARFLTPAWFDELNATANQSQELKESTARTQLTLQQVVRDGPDGDVTYVMRIDRGSVRAEPGPAANADATFTQDYDTATAVVKGDLNAQAAFMTGRIRVSGNMSALLEHQGSLIGLDGVFEQVRATTTF
jgi:putative sterol carrier protein